MKKNNWDRYSWVLPAFWLLANLIQAAFTELDPDEAYYWAYSQELAWGYFDHPPMIAFFVRLGVLLLPGAELGVLLWMPLFQLATFACIWAICNRPRGFDFWVLGLAYWAMPFLHLFGFIATPDTPLLLFVALFYLVFFRFLENQNLSNSLLLGMIAACMLYSKYQGVLVIGFTVLGVSRLVLARRWIYIAGLVAAVLFIPHLWWQYQHGFPSFTYHLSGRNDPYEIKHTTNYLLNQLLIYNPLLLPLLVLAFWKATTANVKTRVFRWNITGVILFFLWATSRGHAEPEWTAFLSIGWLYLLMQYLQTKPKLKNRTLALSLGGIAILLIARVLLISGNQPAFKAFQDREWIEALHQAANGLPVVFQNSYRDPSKYAFYTGKKAYSFTDVYYRKNQYDLWQQSTELNGKPALVAYKKEVSILGGNGRLWQHGRKELYLKPVASFQSPGDVRFSWQEIPQTLVYPGDTLLLTLLVSNNGSKSLVFDDAEMRVAFHTIWFQEAEDFVIQEHKTNQTSLLPGARETYTIQAVVPALKPGKIPVMPGLSCGLSAPAVLNGTAAILQIGEK